MTAYLHAEDWPAIMRESLQASRAQGATFERAWAVAITTYPVPEMWAELVKFVRVNMRAAYNLDDSKLGRLRTEAPVPSVKPRRVRARRPVPVVAASCRWGDGCKATATRGRFGLSFCEEHGMVLEGLREDADRVPVAA